MAIDALASVPLGQSGTGEAVVLKGNGFEDYTQKVLGIRAKEGEERKKTEAEIGKLLQDNIQSKWAQDNINYFQPATQALKDETIKMYKESNGKLDSVQLYGIQSKWNKLKEQALASNSLYEEELTRIKQIEEHPDKVDTEESNKIRQIYADPMSNPTTAKEVQALGGDIVKWRSLNARRFGNIRSYDINDDIEKGFKDKLSKEYKRDKSGKVIWNKTPEGLLVADYTEGLNPEKIATHYSTFWDRTNFEGKKFRDASMTKASKEFDIQDDGTIIALTPDAVKAQMYAPDLKGLSKDQKFAQLGKAMGLVQVKATKPDKEGIATEKPMNIKIDNSAGGGLGWKKFNWPVGKKTVFTNEGGEAKDSQYKAWMQKSKIGDLPYVGVRAKLAEDNKEIKVLTSSGPKNLTTRGFYKNKNNEWVAIADEEMAQPTVIEGTTRPSKLYKPEEIVLNKDTDETATNIAGTYGFDTSQELYDFLDGKAGLKSKKGSANNTNNKVTNVSSIFGGK
jgi:hypothetical protein